MLVVRFLVTLAILCITTQAFKFRLKLKKNKVESGLEPVKASNKGKNCFTSMFRFGKAKDRFGCAKDMEIYDDDDEFDEELADDLHEGEVDDGYKGRCGRELAEYFKDWRAPAEVDLYFRVSHINWTSKHEKNEKRKENTMEDGGMKPPKRECKYITTLMEHVIYEIPCVEMLDFFDNKEIFYEQIVANQKVHMFWKAYVACGN